MTLTYLVSHQKPVTLMKSMSVESPIISNVHTLWEPPKGRDWAACLWG